MYVFIAGKSAAINKRYVFNLTVKDEHNESINASCWGMVDYVVPISSLCYIGAFGKYTRLVSQKKLSLLSKYSVAISFLLIPAKYTKHKRTQVQVFKTCTITVKISKVC